MLDAAHGKSRCPIGVVQRVHVAGVEVQEARAVIAGSIGRRGPGVAARADARQGSRVVVAVARSYVVAIAGLNARGMLCSRPGANWDEKLTDSGMEDRQRIAESIDRSGANRGLRHSG